jgi:hypothetical protein
LEVESIMTKVFVFGAPGSGNLRISEELYMRDDFKKAFNQDPVYKRPQFSADVAWPELKAVIDTNYKADQPEEYEIHAGWWICKFFKDIYEEYTDSVFICVSRYDRTALKKIGVAGTSIEMIEKMGGEEAYKEKIELVDESVHRIADRVQANWINVLPEEAMLDENFTVLTINEDPKPATIKIAVRRMHG